MNTCGILALYAACVQQVLVFAKVWDTGDKYARVCVQQVLVAKVWDICEGVG